MGIQSAAAPEMSATLSSFLGRRRELEELQALLVDSRLVTLTGTGGVGKTRLALELARLTKVAFPDGVWLVELARTESADLVAAAVAESVRASEAPGLGHLERAANKLGLAQQLVILDNCEHVIITAAEACVYLLTHCPRVTVLATSREPLGIEGEQVWSSPGLGLPAAGAADLERIAVSDSVRLFCDRARSVAANFQLSEANVTEVANICRRLDGLPLALELAAAWVPVLAPKELLARLDDSLALLARGAGHQPRQRTMRATLDWSDRLLTTAQRAAFHSVSLFVAGFPLEGAEAVLSNLSADDSPLDLIASLVERSLITVDTTGDHARYRLLEPVRQYAAEKLAARGGEEHEARRRHLQWLVDLAEAAEEHILGGPDLPWLRRLDAELSNVRAALEWGFREDYEGAARLAAALVNFCVVRSLYDEGRSWALQAMQSDGALLIRSLYMAGLLSFHLEDVENATAYLDRARSLLDHQSLPAVQVMVVFGQSLLAGICHGDHERMLNLGEEALALARSLDDTAREMYALEALAAHADRCGDRERAIELLRERIAIARRLDNRWTVGQSLSQIANAAIGMGDTATGRQAVRDGLESAIAVHGRGRDSTFVGYLVEDAGILAIQHGDGVRGAHVIGAARSIFERMRIRRGSDEEARSQRWIETARQGVGSAAADAAYTEGVELNVDDAVAAAHAVVSDQAARVQEGVSSPSPDDTKSTTSLPGAPVTTTDGARNNTFVREGEFWSLTYGGLVVRLKDSKGLRDIAKLLATPRREVAAVDLASGSRPESRRRTTTIADLGLGIETHAGEALDAEARTQYRARLVDLDEDISEAEAANDPERASRAREEREFLLTELAAAVGLGGRPRRALDPAERARKAVTWRVRVSISHIEAVHPALGRHLRRAVRTGSFLVYDPAEPTDWDL